MHIPFYQRAYTPQRAAANASLANSTISPYCFRYKVQLLARTSRSIAFAIALCAFVAKVAERVEREIYDCRGLHKFAILKDERASVTITCTLDRIKRQMKSARVRRARKAHTWRVSRLGRAQDARFARCFTTIETRRKLNFVACWPSWQVPKITLLSRCHPAVGGRNESRRFPPARGRAPTNFAAWKLAGASR